MSQNSEKPEETAYRPVTGAVKGGTTRERHWWNKQLVSFFFKVPEKLLFKCLLMQIVQNWLEMWALAHQSCLSPKLQWLSWCSGEYLPRPPSILPVASQKMLFPAPLLQQGFRSISDCFCFTCFFWYHAVCFQSNIVNCLLTLRNLL